MTTNNISSFANTPSLSQQLTQAKKDFPSSKLKEVNNFTIDMGSAFAFPENRIITDLPAGVYYPSYSRNYDFLLSKASVKHNESVANYDTMFDELETILGEGISDPENQYKIEQAIQNRKHQYLGDGYFPLHNFNVALSEAHKGIIKFLNNKAFYKKSDLGFKRSVLLYGPTGSGKSRYLDWLSKELITELNAIVIRINSVGELGRLNEFGLLTINRMLNNRLIIILIEELSALVSSRNGHLSLLNTLDSPLLRENVLFLATTNNPENIPTNIIARHQRLDELAEISPESNSKGFTEAFYHFVFNEPMERKYKASEWFSKQLTPASLKELFVYSKLNNVDLDESYNRIKEREQKIRDNFRVTEPLGFLG